MTILIFIIGFLLGAVCCAVGFIILHNKSDSKRVLEPGNRNTNGPGQEPKPKKSGGVFIFDFPSGAACAAARKMHFQLFEPSTTMPILPLKDCNRKDDCKCRLREIVEKRRKLRRENRERREDFRFDPSKPAKIERRINADRRSTAIVWKYHD